MPTNQKTGKAWERYIEAEIEACNAIGLGYFARCPEPLRILRNIDGSRVEATYAKKAQPDFYGFLPGGRGVIWDAKLVTDSDRFDFSRVADHQLTALSNASRAGAFSFIYVGRWPEQEKYILPVDETGQIVFAQSKKHIKFSALRNYAKNKGEFFPETILRICNEIKN